MLVSLAKHEILKKKKSADKKLIFLLNIGVTLKRPGYINSVRSPLSFELQCKKIKRKKKIP